MIQILRQICVCTAVCAFAVTRVPSAEAQTTTTALYFDSQPGDWIGLGQQRTWLPGELTFTDDGSIRSRITIRADNFSAASPSTWWYLRFAVPLDAALAPGTYENAGEAFHPTSLRPGLDVSGSGRGCQASGRFQIYEVAFDSAGKLTSFAADFEQHCDDGVPALFGAIRFNSTRSSLVPFDGLYPVFSLRIDGSPFGRVAAQGIDCGDGGVDCDETYAAATTLTLTVTPAPGYTFLAWTGDCANGLTDTITVVGRRRRCTPFFDAVPGSGTPSPPRFGSFLFIDSKPGAFIGRGRRWLLHTAGSEFSAFAGTTSHVSLGVRSPEGDLWSLAFSAP